MSGLGGIWHGAGGGAVFFLGGDFVGLVVAEVDGIDVAVVALAGDFGVKSSLPSFLLFFLLTPFIGLPSLLPPPSLPAPPEAAAPGTTKMALKAGSKSRTINGYSEVWTSWMFSRRSVISLSAVS